MKKSTDEVVQDMIEYLNGQSEKNDKSADPYLAEFAKYKPPFQTSVTEEKLYDVNGQHVKSSEVATAVDKMIEFAITIGGMSYTEFFIRLPDIMNEFWELYVIPQLPKKNE